MALVMLSALACGVQGEDEPGARDGFIRVRRPGAPLAFVKPSSVEGFTSKKDYEFTSDWLKKRMPYWVTMLRPYMGRDDVQYLEVGVFEGRSLLWMSDHVLTGSGSHATGIDIVTSPKLIRNVERSGASDRITLIKGSSQTELRALPHQHYDVIYIDGSHVADDVLEDIVLAWRLLKPGGLLLLDDYEWQGPTDAKAETPATQRPKLAINAFISVFRNSVDVIYKDYQVGLRKREAWCSRGTYNCSPLGEFEYQWKTRKLHPRRGGRAVPLSDDERNVVELLLRATRPDARTLRIHRSVLDMPAFQSLNERLSLGIVPVERPGV